MSVAAAVASSHETNTSFPRLNEAHKPSLSHHEKVKLQRKSLKQRNKDLSEKVEGLTKSNSKLALALKESEVKFGKDKEHSTTTQKQMSDEIAEKTAKITSLTTALDTLRKTFDDAAEKAKGEKEAHAKFVTAVTEKLLRMESAMSAAENAKASKVMVSVATSTEPDKTAEEASKLGEQVKMMNEELVKLREENNKIKTDELSKLLDEYRKFKTEEINKADELTRLREEIAKLKEENKKLSEDGLVVINS